MACLAGASGELRWAYVSMSEASAILWSVAKGDGGPVVVHTEGVVQVTESAPAGWYPDPKNPGQQRYWDGSAWTSNFAPGSAAAAPAAGAVKKPLYKRTWFVVVAVLIGLGLIGNMIGGGTSKASEPTPSTAETTAPPADAEATPATTEPEPEPVAAEKPAEPGMTMSQQQAVAKGQDYLAMSGFSRKGLIDQLVYEGFSKADATFAVDEIAPDWNEQAAKKAQAYIDMTAFSRKGLIDQLVFDGFTNEQAEQGAKAVGY